MAGITPTPHTLIWAMSVSEQIFTIFSLLIFSIFGLYYPDDKQDPTLLTLPSWKDRIVTLWD
jgi:hypothetical protein